MPLQIFKIPRDTKLIRWGNILYKFKLLFTDADPVSLPCSQAALQREMDKAIRVVLHHRNNLFPFCTGHFRIDPECKPWPLGQRIGFSRNQVILTADPNMYILSVKSCVVERDGPRPHTSDDNVVDEQSTQNTDSAERQVMCHQIEVSTQTVQLKNQDTGQTARDASAKNQRRLSNMSESLESHDTRSTGSEQPVHNSHRGKRHPGIPQKSSQTRDKSVQTLGNSQHVNSVSSTNELSLVVTPTDSTELASHDSGMLGNVKSSQTLQDTAGYRLRTRKKQSNISKSSIVTVKQLDSGAVTETVTHQTGAKVKVPRARAALDQEPVQAPKAAQVSNYQYNLRSKRVLLSRGRLASLKHNQSPLKVSPRKPLQHYKVKRLRRRDRQQIVQEDLLEERKLRQHGAAQTARRDRHVIEREELAEDMKLRQLAKPDSPARPTRKRKRHSLLMDFVDNFLTPVKQIFTGKEH